MKTFLLSRKLKLLLLLAVVSAGAVVYNDWLQREPLFGASIGQVHHAQSHLIKLEKIRIKAFYFLPKDRQESKDPNWQSLMEDGLGKLKQFYTHQLHSASDIQFEIYPEPIIGLKNTADYNGLDTNRGNPNALISIQDELNQRLFLKTGDQYDKSFTKRTTGEYQVMAIMYEGVGSSALMLRENDASDITVLDEGLPAFLVSRYFLADEGYKDYGTTIFCHEFGHTLGLPDAYDLSTNQPLTEDIMGSGRFRPLDYAFLSQEPKKQLGLEF